MMYASRYSCLLFLLFAIGCSKSANTGSIVIGHLHQTGVDDEIAGVALAVEEINADGSKHITGRKLKAIHADAGSTPDETQGQSARLITLDKVEALIGGTRWGAVERLVLAAQSPATVAITCNGYAGPQGSQLPFPIGVAPSEVGKTLAVYCKDKLKASKVVVLKEADAVVPGLVAKALMENLPGASEQVIHGSDTPETFKDLKADAVVLCASGRKALAWKNKLPTSSPLLFGGEEADIAMLQGECDGKREFIAVASFHPDDETSREFVQRYQKRYGKTPTTAAALSYDAVHVWAEAARRADSPASDKVREQLTKKQAYFLVTTGSLWFEGEQSPRRPLFLVQIADGTIKLKQRIEP